MQHLYTSVFHSEKQTQSSTLKDNQIPMRHMTQPNLINLLTVYCLLVIQDAPNAKNTDALGYECRRPWEKRKRYLLYF